MKFARRHQARRTTRLSAQSVEQKAVWPIMIALLLVMNISQESHLIICDEATVGVCRLPTLREERGGGASRRRTKR